MKDYNIFFKKLKENNIFNVRTILILSLITLFLLKFKKLFFISFFILLDIVFNYLNYRIKFYFPLKIIDFTIFMSTFTYGKFSGLILGLVHFVITFSMGKVTIYRILIHSFLFIQVLIIPLLKNFRVATAGIIILVMKTIFHYFINLLIYQDFGSLKKNIRRLIGTFFWISVYLTFGEFIYTIMQ